MTNDEYRLLKMRETLFELKYLYKTVMSFQNNDAESSLDHNAFHLHYVCGRDGVTLISYFSVDGESRYFSAKKGGISLIPVLHQIKKDIRNGQRLVDKEIERQKNLPKNAYKKFKDDHPDTNLSEEQFNEILKGTYYDG